MDAGQRRPGTTVAVVLTFTVAALTLAVAVFGAPGHQRLPVRDAAATVRHRCGMLSPVTGSLNASAAQWLPGTDL